MFLKNDSNFQCGLRTKKEVLTIRPQEVVHVLDADIININSKLVKVSEAEYEAFLSKDSNNEPQDTQKSQAPSDAGQPVKEEQQGEVEQKEEGQEEGQEESEEQKQEEQNQVDPESLESLQAKLEALKIKWQEASRPNRKEAIHKQIKEVQEKINKLQ